MVEHLTLNQGVQGSNPWRSTVSTIFEDIGALGMVLFLCAMSHAKNKAERFVGSLLTKERSAFIFNMANAAEAKQLVCELPAWLIAYLQHLPASFRHGSLLTCSIFLRASGMAHCLLAASSCELPAWLIAYLQHLPASFRHGSLLTCSIFLRASGMAHCLPVSSTVTVQPCPFTSCRIVLIG